MSFEDDRRPFIHLLDFGFLPGSTLQVEISNFTTSIGEFNHNLVGFTLSKGDEVNELLKAPSDCILKRTESVTDVIYFLFDFTKNQIKIERDGENMQNLQICSTWSSGQLSQKSCYETSNSQVESGEKSKNNSFGSGGANENDGTGNAPKMPTLKHIPLGIDDVGFSVEFSINFLRKQDEGQYFLIYHNCRNYGTSFKDFIGVSYNAYLVAKNKNTFLSAGEIINPQMYFCLAVLFFATSLFWVHILKTTNDPIYKIHYLMSALVFLKTFSLLFHGINYHFISTNGQQQAVWAVIYYIMHLLKGLMLFGVIILIGTGWTFFKNFLTDRDRRLFMIVLPLQVFDNVALIIKEESEIGQKSYSFWLKLFIFVDLICCAAIILPVIWSIRHLQEASRTDGKAAFNLKKLKLFRHFYIIIICYIYLTRIVNYLVLFTVPFKYSYIVVLVVELGSWLFYLLTGFKFRPAMNNPYLKLSLTEEEDEDMEDVLLQSGALQNVVRVNRVAKAKPTASHNKNAEAIELEEALVNRELSHDLD